MLIRNLIACRDHLDPWLPFPQINCTFSFGPEGLPLPLGALYYLWQRWPAARGPCPKCGGEGYSYSFGGSSVREECVAFASRARGLWTGP